MRQKGRFFLSQLVKEDFGVIDLEKLEDAVFDHCLITSIMKDSKYGDAAVSF